MTSVINAVLPLFAMVLVGFAAMRFRLMGEAALSGLNTFVYFFALPVMLFFTMARSPIDGLFDWRIIAAYSGASVAVFAFVILFMFRRLSMGERTILAGAAGFSNIAYLGVPLMIAAFGPSAGPTSGLILLTDNLILISLVMVFMEGSSGQRLNPLQLVGKVMLGFLPALILSGMLLGAIWGTLRLPIPGPVDNFGTLLGAAAGPCALFALGGTLYGRPIAEGRVQVAAISILKLAVMPALAALLAFHVFDLSTDVAVLIVAIAALPTGANIFVLASHYQQAAARASTIVLITTGLSVATVSALLLWFQAS